MINLAVDTSRPAFTRSSAVAVFTLIFAGFAVVLAGGVDEGAGSEVTPGSVFAGGLLIASGALDPALEPGVGLAVCAWTAELESAIVESNANSIALLLKLSCMMISLVQLSYYSQFSTGWHLLHPQ